MPNKVEVSVADICDALDELTRPHAPRDEWGSASERLCQGLEELRKQYGEDSVELKL